MRKLLILSAFTLATTLPGLGDSFLYGNNATGSTPYIYQIDKTTGAITNTYTNLSGSNGRGVVVVGNTMYYTTATSGSVYSYNLDTKTNNGAAFAVAGASALSTIAYDGTNLIIGDYSGTNKVYTYSTSGSLLSSVSLPNCTGNCDGLEYFQKGGTGFLIENRGDADGPYDLYNLSGTLITAGYITPPVASTTGIAFDGTNFYTSNIFNGNLSEFDINGAYIKNLTLTGAPTNFQPLIEDLSADYSTVLPPPPPPPSTVPEPGTLMLLSTGLLGLAGAARRRIFS